VLKLWNHRPHRKILSKIAKKREWSRIVGGSIYSNECPIHHLEIDGKVFKCLFDTGSPVSFIDKSFLRKHFPNAYFSASRKVTPFTTVSGENFHACGINNLPVKYNSLLKKIPFFITDTPMLLILGVNGLSMLEISLHFKNFQSTISTISSESAKNSRKEVFLSLFDFSSVDDYNYLSRLKEVF